MKTEILCTRKIEFDAAHRVMGHEHKCRFLHGHRYVLEATFAAPNLDDIGRVIDFGEIKTILKTWIDENLDHTTILWKEDKELGSNISSVTNQKVYYMNSNPTAENIAHHLFVEVIPDLFKNSGAKIKSAKLYETPNCSVNVG